MSVLRNNLKVLLSAVSAPVLKNLDLIRVKIYFFISKMYNKLNICILPPLKAITFKAENSYD